MSDQELYIRARLAQERDDAGTARALYRRLIAAQPGQGELYFHLGRLELDQGDAREAAALFRKAQAINPVEPALWLALMDAALAAGDDASAGQVLAEAEGRGLGRDVLRPLQAKLASGNTNGLSDLAGASETAFEQAKSAIGAGDLARALALAEAELAAHPASAPFHTIRAACLVQTRQFEAARASYEAAMRADPAYLPAPLQLGQLGLALSWLDVATEALAAADALAPLNAQVRMSRGILFARQGAAKRAIALLESLPPELAGDGRTRLYLAKAWQDLFEPDRARTLLAEAETKPIPSVDLTMLVNLVADLEGPDRARAIIEARLAQAPDDAGLLSARAKLEQLAGEGEKMRATLRALAAHGVVSGPMLLDYARSGKIAPDDAMLETTKALHARAPEASEDRFTAAFALAKISEDQGDYARAAAFLTEANAAVAGRIPPDPSPQLRMGRLARAAFDAAAHPEGPAPEGPAPIWVTGAPRSGTTLVEQILASHSQVSAGGELECAIAAAYPLCDRAEAEGRRIQPGELGTLARDLTATYARLFPGAARLTDKAINTKDLAGPLLAALPAARMIHVIRDPRDVTLSIYKNLFAFGDHDYTTDLEAIARVIVAARDDLQYWERLLPGRILRLSYEHLVADTEAETRALLEFCDLAWEPACLEFHKTSRQVRTLSGFQVRRKIGAGSIGLWQRYEELLAPAIRIFDEAGLLPEQSRA